MWDILTSPTHLSHPQLFTPGGIHVTNAAVPNTAEDSEASGTTFLRIHSPPPPAPPPPPGSQGAGGDITDNGGVTSKDVTEGPLHWACGRLLDWGSTSPRVALMVACHLATLLDLNPALLPSYRDHVMALLMFTSGGKGEGARH